MADLGATLTGGAADWLAARRSELNSRFERARRRFPRLAGQAVLDALAEHLPPLAGPEPSTDALLSAIYDLVLLHVGRDAFATQPGLKALFRAFPAPALRAHLLARPTRLPAALSNAVETLGARGAAFADGVADLAAAVDGPEALLDAGSLLAWRLGEARLRESALAKAEGLPGRAVLTGLGLRDWPVEAAPLALGALRGDAWASPRDRLHPATVAGAAAGPPERVRGLAAWLAAPAGDAEATWRVVARVGDFSGFGGDFEMPPLVLDGGSRHQLYARSGEQDFAIWADVFGWVCRPCAKTNLEVVPVTTGKRSLKNRLLSLTTAPAPGLAPDGSFVIGKDRVAVPGLAGASAYTVGPAWLAASRDDSYRVRIAVPRARPV